MSDARSLPELDGARTAEVFALAEAATREDGTDPLSEQFLLNLRRGGAREGLTHFLVRDGETLQGYAQLDGDSAELVTHPVYRGRGIGSSLARALAEAGPSPLQVWAHGDQPAAARIAAHLGFDRTRVLLQMRRVAGSAGPLPELVVPDGVRIRPFVVGADEQEFLRVNNAAFDWHPEQGGWTETQVREREAEYWFDAAGFLLAVAQPDGPLLGYHWTKVHPATDTEPAMGEVYVLGVDPAAHGRGLGHVLTLAGLQHLHERGLDTVLLYVESDNVPAVRVYEKLGFTVFASDVAYTR
ncbi:mycothiol synthase [Pseudonocardia sp. T1-2H]|uniref:mycothiol synthase n=1 Tax=Pseudonocardia sp. T1-2H TaxID=3128899 RepID=UPI0031011C6F